MTAVPQPGLVFKLRPTGPWRVGPDSGARDDVDPIYHSDALYSAVTGAMRLLGHLEDWLDATARNASRAALRFLADSGFGGERGRGWGRSETPEFIEGSLPQMILPDQPVENVATAEGEPPAIPENSAATPPAYWLLSLFSPAAADSVDW